MKHAQVLFTTPGVMLLIADRRDCIVRHFNGATENAGFNAKVERNLGLDFVTKQHNTHTPV